MDYSKLFLALSSVLVGWLLAQFTGIAKEWLRRRNVLKCLLEELAELQSELERTLLIYSRQLQIHALQGIDNGVPAPLSNHIFKNYYKDAVLGLNKHQRISIQLIHTMVEGVNDGIREHKALTGRLQEKHMLEGAESITKRDGELWGNKVICEFTNVAATLWHINYHLNKPQSPDLLPYTQDHKLYLQYLGNVEKQIAEILNAAQKLDREQFEKVFDPETFSKQFH